VTRANHRRWIPLAVLALFVLLAVRGLAESPRLTLPVALTIEEGGVFPILVLDALFEHPTLAAADLTWSVAGPTDLLTAIVDGRIYFAAPNTEWSGSETAVVRACVPGGECTESEIVLTVLPVNDPPRLSLPRQLAAPSNEGFDVLDLADYALDIDDEPSDLRWTASGQVALDVVVEGSALITLPPDADWIGAEMIRVEVCDPWGACASGLMQLVVAPEGSLTLTLIECAGFLLAAEGTSVLIDAVYAAPAVRFSGLAEAEPPFEADLILATHSHPDHFDPVVVARYLEARPTATFVGPRDAALRVLAEAPGIDLERVTGVVLDRFGSTELLRGGIRLTLFDLPHGGTPNIGYLIDLGGVRVFHTGDHTLSTESMAALDRWGVRDCDIGVLLALPVHFSSEAFFTRLRSLFGADYYAPVHVKPGSFGVFHRLAAARHDVVVLEDPLERWVLPPDADD
jgi:glyoxylase-like metal-dependent hydrolase (beta-lactamase superfamily II)